MIKVENLVKAFGPKLAVDDVSFTVERGEVLGFLGPNGAGKSTTMRMITGFIPPTDGHGQRRRLRHGRDRRSPAKRLIGYLPENAPSLRRHDRAGLPQLRRRAARALRARRAQGACNRAVELCFLENVLHQTIDTLSKGYKHRTCLAQSLIHDPDVLIMDEPTDGLDPNQKHEVRNLIKRMGANKAIIFSTHILEEVEAACSRVIIIDRGRIVANGTPEELRAAPSSPGAVHAAGARRRPLERLVSDRLGTGGEAARPSAVVRASIPKDKPRAAPARPGAWSSWSAAKAGRSRRCTPRKAARRSVPPHHAARHGQSGNMT